MGFLSDLRNDHFVDGRESIVYLGVPGNSVMTPPTTMDPQEIAVGVGVDLN